LYGGKEIKATKVFFADASQDPWRRASVEKKPGPEETFELTVCHNCGHCAEMRGCPSLPGDYQLNGCDHPARVNLVRENLIKNITFWLERGI